MDSPGTLRAEAPKAFASLANGSHLHDLEFGPRRLEAIKVLGMNLP